MANFKLKICKATGKEFKQYNSLQKCTCCNHFKPLPTQKKVYGIPKMSPKRKVENAQYSVLRIEFLGKKENRVCPITGKEATTVHHKKGRLGDLLLDTNHWVALSMEGHEFVEKNPEWAKENGYSENRLSK